MALSPPTTRRLIVPAMLLVLVASSLAPARWHVYGPYVRDIATRAVWPLTAPMQAAGDWVGDHRELGPLEPSDQLSDKVRRLEGRMIALEQENRKLQGLLAQLQGIRRMLGGSYDFPNARVIGAAADAAAGTVTIDLGTRQGVQPGMAVVDGDELALIGRVIQSGPTTAAVKPLASAGTLIEVLIAPPQLAGDKLDPERRRTCLLEYAGDGLFVANNVDEALVAKVGDLARLSDEGGRIAWPTAVQGMVVGIVRSVEPDPDQPLRQRIEVEPIRSLRTREPVIVVVPRTTDEAGGR